MFIVYQTEALLQSWIKMLGNGKDFTSNFLCSTPLQEINAEARRRPLCESIGPVPFLRLATLTLESGGRGGGGGGDQLTSSVKSTYSRQNFQDWINSKITFQADELLYGDYKKMSPIPKIVFRKFL